MKKSSDEESKGTKYKFDYLYHLESGSASKIKTLYLNNPGILDYREEDRQLINGNVNFLYEGKGRENSCYFKRSDKPYYCSGCHQMLNYNNIAKQTNICLEKLRLMHHNEPDTLKEKFN